MSQQQFQAEVMDELKQLEQTITNNFCDRVMEMISEAYIAGWQEGMKDAKEIFDKQLREQ